MPPPPGAIGHLRSAEIIGERFLGMGKKDSYAELERKRGAPLPASFDDDLNQARHRALRAELGAMPFLALASSSAPAMPAEKLDWAGLAYGFDGRCSAPRSPPASPRRTFSSTRTQGWRPGRRARSSSSTARRASSWQKGADDGLWIERRQSLSSRPSRAPRCARCRSGFLRDERAGVVHRAAQPRKRNVMG